jgi:endogenous inhibitor of DNA gyrase (YacG/DUF329 family)
MPAASKPRIVNCPVCGAPAAWGAGNPHRPFCSERCKLIDLGQWASESYRVPDSQPAAEQPDQED